MGHYWREMASEEELRKHDEKCAADARRERLAEKLTPEKLTKRLQKIEARIAKLERNS